MKLFEELETPSSISSIADRRILDIEYDHRGFFKEGKQYVNLFADLDSISSPDKYRVIFFTNDLRRNTVRMECRLYTLGLCFFTRIDYIDTEKLK
jgi:hypothetical protein